VLFAFAAGRYHNPLIEERALLFIDMRASTAIAERLGELRYLSLLNRFVGDVSFAVAEGSGGIHKYVGDEVIATWHLAPGANPPACVNAAFAALDRIAAQASTYQREFGVVPDFRAGLHCGPVAVGELGSLRREIALIGDTMNTAARILEACRDTNNRVLASAALIERLATLPPGVTRRRLGEFPVRGKERRLELDVLEAEGVEGVEREPSLRQSVNLCPKCHVSHGRMNPAGGFHRQRGARRARLHFSTAKPDVSDGSIATVSRCPRYVRFSSDSDRIADVPTRRIKCAPAARETHL
jgi:class 3 adenylate cyclase